MIDLVIREDLPCLRYAPLLTLSLAEPLCVLLGRQPRQGRKCADEMLIALKANGLPGRLDPLAVLQQAAGPEDAGVDDILHDAEARGLFEAVAQVVFADKKLRRHPFQRQLSAR